MSSQGPPIQHPDKEWPPKVEGVEWIKTTKQQEDELKAAIRAAKAELRVHLRGLWVHRFFGDLTSYQLQVISWDRAALRRAKQDYREWKKTRR